MAKRTFSVAAAGGEEVEFDLQGTDPDGNPIDPIGFRCYRQIQGALLLDVLAALDSEETKAAGEIVDFIGKCMPPEERERFNEVIRSDKVLVDIQLLAEIMAWLAEQYTERPTVRPSSFASGQSPTGITSTAASNSPELQTPMNSQPVGSAT